MQCLIPKIKTKKQWQKKSSTEPTTSKSNVETNSEFVHTNDQESDINHDHPEWSNVSVLDTASKNGNIYKEAVSTNRIWLIKKLTRQPILCRSMREQQQVEAQTKTGSLIVDGEEILEHDES